jgi:hypothetical protein
MLRNKFGNKKVVVDGIKFDSKLELYCFKKLIENKIKFDFQVTIELQEKFRYHTDKRIVLPIAMRVDFIAYLDGWKIIIDTKGFATPEAKIKYKILKYKYRNEPKTTIIWCKNNKEVDSLIFKTKYSCQQ